MRKRWISALALVLMTAAQADELRKECGWVRLPPPGARMAAGYATLLNEGPAPVSIVGVSSPAFASAMLHETVVEDGMSKMRHLDTVEVPPGGRFEFAPGGAHIMFMGPAEPLAEGQSIPLTLEFASGETQTIHLLVERA